METQQIVVGCKLPSGFWMENVVAPADPKQLQPLPVGDRVFIAGSNTLVIKGTNPLVGDVAYTTVDKEFAEKWFADHKDWPMCKKGFVFKADKLDRAQAIGKERGSELNGLEPLNPKGDKRTDRKMTPDPEHAKLRGQAA